MPSPSIWANTPIVMGVSSRGRGLGCCLALLLVLSLSFGIDVVLTPSVDGVMGVLFVGRCRMPARIFVDCRGDTNEDDGTTSNTDNRSLDIDIILGSLIYIYRKYES